MRMKLVADEFRAIAFTMSFAGTTVGMSDWRTGWLKALAVPATKAAVYTCQTSITPVTASNAIDRCVEGVQRLAGNQQRLSVRPVGNRSRNQPEQHRRDQPDGNHKRESQCVIVGEFQHQGGPGHLVHPEGSRLPYLSKPQKAKITVSERSKGLGLTNLREKGHSHNPTFT